MFIMAKDIKQVLNNRKFSAFHVEFYAATKDDGRVGKIFTVSYICADLCLFTLGLQLWSLFNFKSSNNGR